MAATFRIEERFGRTWRSAESLGDIAGYESVEAAEAALDHLFERESFVGEFRIVPEHVGAVPAAPSILCCRNEQISALRDEAIAAGDMAQVVVCDRALAGQAWAISSCIQTIKNGCGR